MKNLEPFDLSNKVPPTARTQMADPGAGSFRTALRFFPVSHPARRERPLAAPVVPVAALCLLGLFGFYLKFEIMGPQWSLAARLYGSTGGELGALERFGFYFDDLLFNFILLPLAGALIGGWMPRRLRTFFFAGATIAAAFLYFFQLRAHAEIGHYVSLQLITELFVWALHNPGIVGDYLSVGSLLKLGLFLALLGFLFAGEHLPSASGAPFRRRLASWHRGLSLLLAAVVPGIILLLLPFSYAYYPTGINLQKSAVARILTALAGSEGVGGLQLDRPVNDLADEFRRQTAHRQPLAGDPRIGAEAGADILVFVVETTPAQVFDLRAEGKKLPGIGRLYERSFLGDQHYSTYPYTSDALYSLLSGLYPQGRRQLLQPAGSAAVPALMGALDPQEYSRTVYAPDLYGAEQDDRMYRLFGADRTYYAVADAGGEARQQAAARAERLLAGWEKVQPAFAPDLRQKAAEKLTLDLQALAKLKADIVAAKQAGRRYCSLFLPQIGHGPWLNLHGRGDLAARGRDLVLLQDAWLAEIIDLLAGNGWLDETIIVFAADHGIRTRAEDPELNIGRLSSRMLQVPLLIHAPRTLREPTILAAPTSHIDIAPTVLALLGKTEYRQAMQGVPVWLRSDADRIFLFASQYAGADGYIENGVHYMHHLLSDAVFASDSLDFEEADMLRPHDDRSQAVRRNLREATAIQISIVRRLIRDGHALRTAAGLLPPAAAAGVPSPMR